MTTNEYIEMFLMSRTEAMPNKVDEETAIEISQLVSGSFVYPLFESVTQAEYDTNAIIQHLEDLYDSANYFGFIYFIMFLAETTGCILPSELYILSLKNDMVPILAAAIIDDWLDVSEYLEYKQGTGIIGGLLTVNFKPVRWHWRKTEPNKILGSVPFFYHLLTFSLNVLPAVNAGVLDGATFISSPVRGFFTVLSPLARLSKLPNPVICTFSPLATSPWIILMKLSTTASTSRFFISDAFATASTNCVLFIFIFLLFWYIFSFFMIISQFFS